MFGQPANNSPFGGGATSGFGQNTAPAFGQPNNQPSAFGGGGGFGAPAPSTPFGAPAPASNTGFGGGFGSNNTGGSAFGSANNNAGGFGAPSPAPSGFSGFGSPPAPAPSTGFGGGFGASPAPSSLFGAPSNQNTFGAPSPATNTFGGFGSSPAPSSGFGAPSTFGAPSPAPGGFASGGFGSSPAPAPGTSLFGSTTPAAAPSTGLFGAPAAPTFGAPAPSNTGFGFNASPAPAASNNAFGAPSTSTFGQTTNQGGMFGGAPSSGGGTRAVPYQATSRQDGANNITLHAITAMQQYESKSFEELRFEDYSQGNKGGGSGQATGFGTASNTFASPAPPQQPSAFGGFSSTTPAPSTTGGSLFGASSATPAPAFGAPAPATNSGFGFGSSPAPAGGLFGSSAPAPAPSGGLFGGATTPASQPSAFGFSSSPAPSATGGSLFGSSTTPAPAFGAPAATTGGFGFGSNPAPAPAPGGLFNSAPAPAGGLFSPSPAPAFGFSSAPAAPAPAPGFGFAASPATPSTGLFNTQPAQPAQQPVAPQAYVMPPAGSIIPPAANELLAQQLSALDKQAEELQKADVWTQASTPKAAVTASSNSDEAWTALNPSPSSYSTYHRTPLKSSTKIRPRGFGLLSPDRGTPSVGKLGSGARPMMTPDSIASSQVKRLVINPSPRMKLKQLTAKPNEESATSSNGQPLGIAAFAPSRSPAPSNGSNGAPTSNGDSSPLKSPAAAASEYYNNVVGSPSGSVASRPTKPGNAPTLTKAGYVTTPSMDVLNTLSGEDLAAVENFSIEHQGYGRIEWEGAVDVRGADLDRIVEIDQSVASMYEKDEEENRKPAVGSKLNRQAIITLYSVFPKQGPSASDDVKDKFAEKVKSSTKKMGAQFISYDKRDGEWKMRVQHFSKYGLLDEDSESNDEAMSDSNFQSGENQGHSHSDNESTLHSPEPMKKPTGAMLIDDDDDDDVVLGSGSDMELVDEESKMFEEAEAAYTKMITTISGSPGKDDQDTSLLFEDDCEEPAAVTAKRRYIPTMSDIHKAKSGGSISSTIAAKSSVKKFTTDFGMRMGKSFRGGWSSNGTFVTIDSKGNPIQHRPVFTDSIESKSEQAELLKTLKSFSEPKKGKECPTFSLGGNSKLHSALESFASNKASTGSSSVSTQAFSLLRCFLDPKSEFSDQLALNQDNQVNDTSLEERRILAISEWLASACSDEVDKEIGLASVQRNSHAALLAAMSGGDVEKAVSLADELGFRQLAAMLSSGPIGRENILKEANSWDESSASPKITDELRRVYFLAGGDIGMEELVCKKKGISYDWIRRLGMRLGYGGLQSCSVEDLMVEYEASISNGLAPYPYPKYFASSRNDEVQCVLYRILQMARGHGGIPLSNVIDPVGYTSSRHDFGLGFHLAAVISAMGMSSDLSSAQESQLVDGYVAQLLSCGQWQWAVYISLFKINDSTPISENSMAKSLVLQLYRDDIHSYQQQREFLEGVGIPSEWFEEALAIRCLSQGLEYDYFSHMVRVSPDAVRSTIEKIWIPNMFVMDKDNLQKALQIIETFAPAENSLASAVCDFFEVYQSIRYLEGRSKDDIQKALPSLHETCDNIERIFSMYRSRNAGLQGTDALEIIPSSKLVPLASFLAEGLAQVCLFRLQIRALENGSSISKASSQLLTLTMTQSGEKFGVAAENEWLRWLM